MSGTSVKGIYTGVKEYWIKLTKKQRTAVIAVAAVVVLGALLLTVLLNRDNSGYEVLYPNMSAAESGSVYQALLEMGAQPKIGSGGSVMVPVSEVDIWILQLAARGYPQTALPYDVFSSHSGLTTTESEKKQWLAFQLQDRIQATLKRISGVENATVTINMPETSDYVWKQAESTERATAGVLLSLGANVTLNDEQVTAIKNLIASSIPQMQADDVTVVNAKTGLQLDVKAEASGITNGENLQYEQSVQSRIEENVVRVLAPRYGTDGVVAVAKVTIDYDKMMTERMELIQNPETGGGYVKTEEGKYTVNGELAAGGVVGEENNTDIPQYGYTAPKDENGMTYYWWNKDYDYGYIKTQVERGSAELKRATVSVMVNEKNLTQAQREELTSLVSKSADIDPEFVFVSSFEAPEGNVTPPTPEATLPIWQRIPVWAYAAAGTAILLLIAALIVVRLIVKRRKGANSTERMASTRLGLERMQQSEIDEHKRYLEELAMQGLDVKDEAVTSEVRTFAKQNPEIAANLIRSWLKEGE